MRFHKENFLNSHLGKNLEIILENWNTAYYEEKADTAFYKEDNSVVKQCEMQWNIYELIFRELYNKDCYMHKTHDFFGIILCSKKGDDWLIKLDRAGIIKDRHYTNEDKKCECYLCEYENICQVANRSQRLPRNIACGLGECWKLEEE